MAYWLHMVAGGSLSHIHDEGSRLKQGFDTIEDAEAWASYNPSLYYISETLKPIPGEEEDKVEYGVTGNFTKTIQNSFLSLEEAKEHIEKYDMKDFHIQPFTRVGNAIYQERVQVVKWSLLPPTPANPVK